jgi:CBS domain containing-hemolysin-like protein
MTNAPLHEGEHPQSDDAPEQEPSWLERLLARFGLGEEPNLREVIEDALARGQGAPDDFSAQERKMLLNILRFGKLTVEDVMVPRADIVAVEEQASVDEVMRVFRQAEHSRLPIYRETLDDPRGMIHIRDLMSWITTEAEVPGGEKLDLGAVDLSRAIGAINITRELLYVPPSMPVLDLLLRMQASRRHLALVVDEYGGTDGLVSIEDLVEEVVGEIEDEHDVAEEPLFREDARLGLIADARTPIEDLERYLGVQLISAPQEEDIDTLGGLVFALSGRIPARGEVVWHPTGVAFEVLDADRRRIKKLRIRVPAKSEADDAGASQLRDGSSG